MEQKTYKQMTRQERGELIFKNVKIAKTPFGWRVPSQSHNGYYYLVEFKKDEPKCSCSELKLGSNNKWLELISLSNKSI